MKTPIARRIPPLANIFPGPHTLRLEEHFGALGGAHESFPPLAGVGWLRHAYFICFTNRCGSNFVAQAIASSGRCERAGEWLNYGQVINVSQERGIDTYGKYLSWLMRKSARKSGVFGCKASPDQLIHLYNIGVLDQLRDRLTLIHVVRDDVVGQAISMLRARATNQWTSEQTSTGAAVRYDANALVQIMYGIQRATGAFRTIFQLMQVEPLTVRYEAFVEDPATFVARIGDAIGLPGLEFAADALTLKKQSNAENDRFRTRLMGEFGLGGRRRAAAEATRQASTRVAGEPVQS